MDTLRNELEEHRDRLLLELEECETMDCPVHRDDWQVLITVYRMLGESFRRPERRRRWWEE